MPGPHPRQAGRRDRRRAREQGAGADCGGARRGRTRDGASARTPADPSGASSAAKSIRPSASTVTVSVARTLIVPAFAVEQRDLADRLPWTGAPDLDRAIPRQLQRGRQDAVDDEHHLPRVVPLSPEELTVAHGPPAHHPCQLHEVRLLTTLEQRNAGENSTVSRSTSRSRVSNSILPARVRRQHRVFGHLEPRRDIRRQRLEAMITERGASAAVICQ